MDKITREAAFENMVVVLRQLTEATSTSIDDWRLPREIVTRRIKHGEVRMFGPDELPIIVNGKAGTLERVVPAEFLNRDWHVATHATDRGPIVAAFLHYAVHKRFAFVPWFDWFHGLWNGLKHSLKKCGPFAGMKRNWMWVAVLELMAVFNMNHGPFRSAQWFSAKKLAARRWCQQHSATSPEFVEIAPLFARDAKVNIDTPEEMQALFDRMKRLRSCSEAGPVMKLNRWCSIQECFEYHEEGLYGLKAILTMLAEEHKQGATLIDVDAGTNRGANDDDKAAVMNKNGSTVVRAPTYINEKNLSALRIFCCVSSPQRRLYEEKATNIQNLEDGMEWAYRLLFGAWQAEARETVAHALYDVAALDYMRVRRWFEPSTQEERCCQVLEFLMHVLKSRAEALLFPSTAYPAKFLLAVHGPEHDRKAGRHEILTDWQMAQALEQYALKDAEALQLMNTIFFLDWPLVRLCFTLLETEQVSKKSCGFEKLARAMVTRWSDSKAAEDVHQHLRDETRRRRYTYLCRSRVYRTQTDANIAKQRGMEAPTVTEARPFVGQGLCVLA